MSANELRRLCFEFFPDSADFEAFLLDYFPDVHRETSQAMLRSARMNVLLERHGAAAVWQALRAAHPHTHSPLPGTGDPPAGLDPHAVGEIAAVGSPPAPSQRQRQRITVAAALSVGLTAALLASRGPSWLRHPPQGAIGRAAGPQQKGAPPGPPPAQTADPPPARGAPSTSGAKSPILLGNSGSITINYFSAPAPAAPAPGPKSVAAPGPTPGPRPAGPPTAGPASRTAIDCKAAPCRAPLPRALPATSLGPAPSSHLWLPTTPSRTDGQAASVGTAPVALYRRPAFWGAIGGGAGVLIATIVIAAVAWGNGNALEPGLQTLVPAGGLTP